MRSMFTIKHVVIMPKKFNSDTMEHNHDAAVLARQHKLP